MMWKCNNWQCHKESDAYYSRALCLRIQVDTNGGLAGLGWEAKRHGRPDLEACSIELPWVPLKKQQGKVRLDPRVQLFCNVPHFPFLGRHDWKVNLQDFCITSTRKVVLSWRQGAGHVWRPSIFYLYKLTWLYISLVDKWQKVGHCSLLSFESLPLDIWSNIMLYMCKPYLLARALLS
jgi:hypothetical protein